MKHETPIQECSFQVNSNSIYVKRDDLGLFSFGGNKWRKALHFFKEVEDQQARTVVTYGSSSSNHCRVVAHQASAKGIGCIVISPEEEAKETYNRQMVLESGAKIVSCPLDKVAETIDSWIEKLSKEGRKPYFIPGGGHGYLGTEAYVKAFEEILSYESSEGMVFDAIYLASGTGATQAGLVAGTRIHGTEHAVHGISIARKNPRGSFVVLESVNEYLQCHGLSKMAKEDISFIDDYVLEGYGHANEDIKDWIKRLMHQDGIPMDSTYTGKAFWGMTEHLKAQEISNQKILFLHTGGTPLFFDDLRQRKEENK